MARKDKKQKTNTQSDKTSTQKDEKKGLLSALLDSAEGLRDRYKNDPQFRDKVKKGGIKFLQKIRKKIQEKRSKTEQPLPETEQTQKTGSNKMIIYGGIGLLVLILLMRKK